MLRLFLLALLLVSVVPTLRAQTTITVDTLSDDEEANGNCTLREAIIASNTNAAVDGCPAGTGEDTITFSVTGTIELAEPLPPLQQTATVQGPGFNVLTIDANQTGRVLRLNGQGHTHTYVVSGLTLTGGLLSGDEGGGIEGTDATVHLSDCVITGNAVTGSVFGGGIYFANTNATVEDCVIHGNAAEERSGGGIAVGAVGGEEVILNRVYIYDNEAGETGGGLMVLGNNAESVAVRVLNSTIAGNTAADGGGIYANKATLEIANTTISGNQATLSGAGIYFTGSGGATANLRLFSTTITNNEAVSVGGGVLGTRSGVVTVELQNTVIAGNTSNSDLLDIEVFGTLVSHGYNLIGVDTGDPDYVSTDLLGTINDYLEPMLGPLADNGGPWPSHALLAGSLALNAGNPSGCMGPDAALLTNDQRGADRVQEGRCDIGAIETGDAGIGTNREAADIPVGHALSAVYPNPFNPEATFTLEMTQPQAVTVTVHDVLGRQVAVLHEGALGTGSHRYTLAASAWPSGLYLVRVEGEHFVATRRAVLLK